MKMQAGNTMGLVLCCAATIAHGQKPVTYTGSDYFGYRDQLQAHYDSLAAAGDSTAFGEGGDYTEFKKWAEFWNVRLTPESTIEDYYHAYAECIAAGSNKSGNGGAWHEVGPKDRPMVGEASIGQGSQPGIGPIGFISFCPSNPDKMLCGSYGGGLFYTDNAGIQWNNAGSDGWNHSNCRHAVFNASDEETWYAVNNGQIFWTGLILRTNDAGASWLPIADYNDFAATGTWYNGFHKLLSDPVDPDVLFAAGTLQLYRTENANDPDPIWTELTIPVPPSILSDPVYGSYPFTSNRFVYDLEMHPTDHMMLYATVRFDAEISSTDKVQFWRMMRSIDGGDTWTEMPNQPTHTFTQGVSPPGNQWDRNAETVTIEVTAADPDRLFVFYDRTVVGNNYVDELWRIPFTSTGTWDAGPLRADIRQGYGAGNGFGVAQDDPNNVFIEDNVGGSVVGRYLTFIGGIWYDYYSLLGNKLQYHVDVEDFVGHPDAINHPDEVWMANHGGVHRSTDNGATWEWRGAGLGVAEIYRMSTSYTEPEHVLMGLFHDAIVLSEGPYQAPWAPTDWRQLGGADGQKTMIDPKEGNWMFWSSQDGSWDRSQDHGITSLGMSPGGTGDWNTEGAMDQKNPATLYIPVKYGSNAPMEIRRTMDHGATFETVSDFLGLLGPGGAGIWRVYPSSVAPNHLYAFFSTGNRLFRTTIARQPAADVQSSWVEIDPPRNDAWPADVKFDRDDPDVLYFAYGSSATWDYTAFGEGREMLYRVDYSDPAVPLVVDLTGSSITWAPLPNTGVNFESLALERGSDGGIYLATDIGVYHINNKGMADGTGWQILGGGLPRVQCKGLEINYKVNKLRAGLSGRGLWEHDLWCPDLIDMSESGAYVADEFLEVQNNIASTAIVDPGLDITYRAGNTVHLTPDFHAWEGARFHAFIHPCDQQGNSFKQRPVALDHGAAPNIDLDKGDRENVVAVVPNPNRGAFLLTCASDHPIVGVELFDALGRSVHVAAQPVSVGVQCTLSPTCASGLYHIRVRLGNGSFEQRTFSIQ